MLRQIKASAGSGKTYRLTGEFLDRLQAASEDSPFACGLNATSSEYCWPEILAVTFTNKAAAEMKERIIRTLKERALGMGASGPAAQWQPKTARRWVNTLLKRYSSLNVRTIDSLLHMLVRLCALELGLPPDFEPVFDEKDIFDPLYDKLLDKARTDSGELQELLEDASESLLYHGNTKGFMAGDRLRDNLLSLMRYRMRHPEEEMPAVDSEELKKRIINRMLSLQDSARFILQGISSENLSASAHYTKFLSKVTELGQLESPPISAMGTKQDLNECLNKKSKGAASDGLYSAHSQLTDDYAWLHTEGQLLRKALQQAPFIRLVNLLTEEAHTVLKQDGMVPNALWPSYARTVLSGEAGASEAFCRMGTQLTHLLVDEFQDTSNDQWQAMLPLAIECMAKGGSVTYVGDVKQAIYSWRGGDSDLFDGVLEDPQLLSICPEPQKDPLPFNWRSSEVVVTTNNRIFEPLADKAIARQAAKAICDSSAPDEVVENAASRIQRSFAGTSQQVPEFKKDSGGLVRLYNITAESAESLRDSVREELHGLVMHELTGRRQWRDIAVLVRSNSEAGQIVRWLIDWNVPVITENSLRLNDHPLISQTVAFMQFLDYPLDELALCTVLSGCELFGGAACLHGASVNDWLASRDNTPLLPAFRKAFPELWDTWFAPFYAQAGLMSAYDTVQELFNRFNIDQRHSTDTVFIRRFLEIIHAADSKGMRSLSTFLEYWHEDGKEEKVPMPDNLNAVRIMTMHKSKGLEFPVVIIPFHHHALQNSSTPVRAMVDGMDVMVTSCKELGTSWYNERAKEACEQLNLLYVAWTRPVDELHAFLTSTSRNEDSAPMLTALRVVLGDEFPEAGETVQWGESPENQAEMKKAADPCIAPCEESCTCTPQEQIEGSEPAKWTPMEWLPTLKIFRNPLEEMVFDERRRGELAHSCMEALTLTGDAEADVRRAIDHSISKLPFALPDKEKTEAELYSMLSWAASLPQMPEWLSYGIPEQSIMDADGAMHRVDLYVDNGHACTIVEYKTGSESSAHRQQVTRYLNLLKQISTRPAQGVIVYLDLQKTITVDS
ncbi:UvrD-helicase domain-containing protein [Oleidesulfovibrio sp.]|uniref:UvrD-helicase domain-containing protein n=1 Tax=Oleidesulfovibrio sp. TaxID=2909707 RepID=UPI003A84DCD5